MAFPKHPIIDVNPVDAARGAAAAAQTAAEPFTPPSFGKRVGRWTISRCIPRSSTATATPFAIKEMPPLPLHA